jgi:hypothetical protein
MHKTGPDYRIEYKIKAKLLDDSSNHKKLNPMIAKKIFIVSRPTVNPKYNIRLEACGDVTNLFFFE